MFGIHISIGGQGRSYQLPPCPITTTLSETVMSKTEVYLSAENLPREEEPTHLNFKSLIGNQYGRLTVLQFSGRRGKAMLWGCQCLCGAFLVVTGPHLTSGHSTSCGCRRSDVSKALTRTHGLTSGGSWHYLYSTFVGIIARCKNPNSQRYARYGGRGIECKFAGPTEFAEYISKVLGDRPIGHSLDRIDLDGHYEPGNLQWADPETQMRKTSRTHWVLYQGRKMSLTEAAELAGLPPRTVADRVTAQGWAVEDALSTPVGATRANRSTRWVSYGGVKIPAIEASEFAKLPYAVVRLRLSRGWSDYDALHTPVGQKRSKPPAEQPTTGPILCT